MWLTKSQSRRVSRGKLRNRKSIKPNVDGLEERRLLSFSPVTYSIFPQATVTVAGKRYSNGNEIRALVPVAG